MNGLSSYTLEELRVLQDDVQRRIPIAYSERDAEGLKELREEGWRIVRAILALPEITIE